VLHIINYFVKFLTIIIGVVLLTGIFFKPAIDANPMLRVLGGILIAWGLYRIIIYRIQSKRYRSLDDEEENDEN
jgi:hypothetical protein